MIPAIIMAPMKYILSIGTPTGYNPWQCGLFGGHGAFGFL